MKSNINESSNNSNLIYKKLNVELWQYLMVLLEFSIFQKTKIKGVCKVWNFKIQVWNFNKKAIEKLMDW